MRGYPRKNNQPQAPKSRSARDYIPRSWTGRGDTLTITHEESNKTCVVYAPEDGMSYPEARACANFIDYIFKIYPTATRPMERVSLVSSLTRSNEMKDYSRIRSVTDYLNSVWPGEFSVYVERRYCA